MDFVTTLVVIVVILLVFQLTKNHKLSVITEDGKLERVLLSLAGGYLAWVGLNHLQSTPGVTGADEDNVLAPSDLGLDEY